MYYFSIMPYLARFRLFMKKALAERNIVVLLFVLVLIVFSFAQRDSKKLEKLYSTTVEKIKLLANSH